MLFRSPTPCDDGNLCTKNDICKSGKCTSEPVQCDLKVCAKPGLCDPLEGCKYEPMPKNVDCDDKNPCTYDSLWASDGMQTDRCDGFGTCVSGAPKNCDDAKLCTDDSCDPKSTAIPQGKKQGCEYKNNVVACNDGDPCTQGELCTDGACALPPAATPVSCDDGNACTLDSCVSSANPPFGYVQGCNNKALAIDCNDGDICTTGDACKDGACAGKPVDCDDQNVCTTEKCNSKSTQTNPDGSGKGCEYAPVVGQNPCGGFAECSSEAIPKCVFPPGQHFLISELYFGAPENAADDFVEIHNPTDKTISLEGYALQWRPFDSVDNKAWLDWVVLPKDQTVNPHGYLLVAAQAAVPGAKTDVVVPGLSLLAKDAVTGKPAVSDGLPKAGFQLRIIDKAYLLTHDFVCVSVSTAKTTCNAGSTAAPATTKAVMADALFSDFNTANSMERKASATSTRDSMFLHAVESLAGNDWDTDSGDDFVLRWAPEPQNSLKVYEPACKGSCPDGKVCSYEADPTKSACKADQFCAAGCGVGEVCNAGNGHCEPALASAVFSEIYPGDDAPYVELYAGCDNKSYCSNVDGKLVVDWSGFEIGRAHV